MKTIDRVKQYKGVGNHSAGRQQMEQHTRDYLDIHGGVENIPDNVLADAFREAWDNLEGEDYPLLFDCLVSAGYKHVDPDEGL